MRKQFKTGLLCILVLAVLTGAAWAEDAEEVPYWGGAGAYKTEEEPAQTSQQQTNAQTNNDSAADPFAGAYRQTALEQADQYVNQTLYNDPLLDDMGLTVYLNRIDLDTDGNMTFNLTIRNTSDHGIAYKSRIEITVGDSGPQRVQDMTGSISMLYTDAEFSYDNVSVTAANPALEDVLLHIWIVEVDSIFSDYHVLDGREITLPIHFLGDYLQEGAKGAIHLPVLEDGISTEMILNNDWLTLEDRLFSVHLLSISDYSAFQFGMVFETVDSFEAIPRLRATNFAINGTEMRSGVFLEYNGEYCVVIYEAYDGEMPFPVETVYFDLVVLSEELDHPYVIPVSFIFDGVGMEMMEEESKADQKLSAAPYEAPEDTAEVHLHLSSFQEEFDIFDLQEPIVIYDNEGYTINIYYGEKEDYMFFLEGEASGAIDGDVMAEAKLDAVNDEKYAVNFLCENGISIGIDGSELISGQIPEKIETIAFKTIQFFGITGYHDLYIDDEFCGEEPEYDASAPIYETGPITLIFD